MMNETELLNKVLVKYKFTDPISIEDQKFAIISGRDNLKYILKKTGYYSTLYGLILTLLYWARIFGIKATLFKSKVIVGFITVNMTTAGVVGVKYVQEKVVSTILEQDEIVQEIGEFEGAKKKAPIKKSKIDEYVFSNIRVRQFKGDDAKLAKIVTYKIADNLKKLLAQNQASEINGQKREIDKMVTGSVRLFGSSYHITGRLINLNNIKVEYATSVEAYSKSKIGEACLNISRKIADKLR